MLVFCIYIQEVSVARIRTFIFKCQFFLIKWGKLFFGRESKYHETKINDLYHFNNTYAMRMRLITLSTSLLISSRLRFLYFSRAIAAISERNSAPLFGANSNAAVAPTIAPPRRANSILVTFVIVGLVKRLMIKV